jgi:hypothetical protein
MSLSTSRALRGLARPYADAYEPHVLHHPSRTYAETNCYTDVLIELLHACGYEPLATLGHLVASDFEGDQWTFLKPPPGDLDLLFGVDIHEMQPYRDLPAQIAEQLDAGRTMIVEVDAWHLPDTASTSYRREHVKTSVAAAGIDPCAHAFAYFHNAGLHQLTGDDYRGALRVGAALPPVALPPYTELVRFDASAGVAPAALRSAALGLLRRHLARRPATNPFERFGAQLIRELPSLLAGDLQQYHAYAFATVRMAGAAFELTAAHAKWLFGAPAGTANTALDEIVGGCKVLSFRLARRRPFDPGPAIETLARAWHQAMASLEELTG